MFTTTNWNNATGRTVEKSTGERKVTVIRPIVRLRPNHATKRYEISEMPVSPQFLPAIRRLGRTIPLT